MCNAWGFKLELAALNLPSLHAFEVSAACCREPFFGCSFFSRFKEVLNLMI
jgi:hypothetical protein